MSAISFKYRDFQIIVATTLVLYTINIAADTLGNLFGKKRKDNDKKDDKIPADNIVKEVQRDSKQKDNKEINIPIRTSGKVPVHIEIPGDYFDRQRVIVGFDQKKIESTHAFILGVGGLGQNIAMALCRLGVQHIYLLDFDIVEESNLNRHILATKNDIGKKKVEMAKVIENII